MKRRTALLLTRQLALITSAVAFVVVLVAASPALAQDAGRVGMVVGYPGLVGVHWQISDRFAIRGDAGYSWSSSETTQSDANEPTTSWTSGSTIVLGGLSSKSHSESSSQVTSIGLSALFTVHKTDDLRLYVAPKISLGISHVSGSLTTELVGPPEFLALFPDRRDESSFSQTDYSTSYSASFGGSTMINRRFGVFGEAGLVFSQSDDPLVISRVPVGFESTRKSLSTRGAVGITLFF